MTKLSEAVQSLRRCTAVTKVSRITVGIQAELKILLHIGIIHTKKDFLQLLTRWICGAAGQSTEIRLVLLFSEG